ncbi:MAG TPA: hypothetical protein PKK12_11480 [Candidatus Aminicenantes bacterium]|nr:hypothetical protein [Candidatus Aminicenantes bacterium]
MAPWGWLAVAVLVLLTAGLTLGWFAWRIRRLEDKLARLLEVGSLFPEFLRRSETLAHDLGGGLEHKLTVLQKAVGQADVRRRELEFLEQKIQEQKLSQDQLTDILILANQGFSVEEIATRLNVPVGEAQLVIGLRRYLNSPESRKLEGG